MATSDLRDIPAIRAEAERVARDVYEAQSKTLHANGMGPSLLWELLPERMRVAYVGAHVNLLTDLTRPASRDAIIRLCIEADIRGVDEQAEIAAIITEWTSYRDDIERIAYLAPVSLGADHD